MHVALNGWFSGRSVGSGRYTDQLLAALRTTYPDDRFEAISGDRRGGNLGKLVFEQIVFPRLAAGADVAHVPYWAPPMRSDTPLVVTVHDLIPVLLPEYRSRLEVRAYVELVRRATLRAAAVLVDSHSTAADLTKLTDVEADRVHVVPLGVGREFHPGADGGAPTPDGLPGRFGLYVGGFDRRKNLETLLAAWRAVHAATGVPLVVAGRLPEPSQASKPHPAELARRLGLPEEALIAVGEVTAEALPDLYRAASVFAYPSRYEGFGLPPLEAMACGTPVVAADATSLPEVVGDAGLLVAPDDVEAWTAALSSVLEDGRVAAGLTAAGPSRAASFTWAETARRTHDVYRAMLA